MASLIQNDTLSHGTVECTDMAGTRAFLTEFLGLDLHRPFDEAQYMYKGGPWTVVCVRVDGGDFKDQPTDNRFKLAVDDPADVDRAHAAALAVGSHYGIRNVGDVTDNNGVRSVLIQDLNFTWWEITTGGQSHYDALFAAAEGTV